MIIVSLVVFAVVLIICSLFCIYRNQRKISFLVEALVLLLAISISILIDVVSVESINYINLILIFGTFWISKFVILVIVKLFEIRSFYWKRDISRKASNMYFKSVKEKRFERFVENIRRIEYGPRLKYGLPEKADKKDSETNIRFDTKGFPIFKEVIFEMKLKRKDFNKSREVHFNRASRALYEKAQKDKRFAKKFTKQELEIFEKGKVPKRFSWHHHQDKGRMQLVKFAIHDKVYHKGGFAIWGKREKKN